MSAERSYVCNACREAQPSLLSCIHTFAPPRPPKFDPEGVADGWEWREGLKGVSA